MEKKEGNITKQKKLLQVIGGFGFGFGGVL